ncbi:MAG TPA: FAD-dependent oxidoreductase [Puia sp.]|nr:FAD-dependent oxidoreductase [Puia sp.]
MTQPIIFTIDDDAQVLRAITRDLRSHYRSDYRILSTTSAKEALDSLLDLKNKSETVALIISDQRMPEMEGVDFFKHAIGFFPDAKRVLLTAYSDTDAAIRAINDIQLDYYLMKPWDPPEERLYPTINGLLEDWQSTYRPAFKGIKVLGYQFSPKSHDIKEFLSGNLVPYQWLDVENNEEGGKLMKLNNILSKDLPAIFLEDGSFLAAPTIPVVAEKIGLSPTVKNNMYDVVIIGAGPAGLAASVYGASEGLKTLLVERHSPGGQAGTSSRIENYLGFPTGLSGADLTRRAVTQANRLGAELFCPGYVKDIRQKDGYKKVILDNDQCIDTHAVVITTGVDYRKLDTRGIADFTGAGIYYGAAMTEAAAFRDKEVYVVGGGNSAGQAAMYLSKFAKNVYVLIRKENLTSTMSAYLIDQLATRPNIHIMGKKEIGSAAGSGRLEELTIEDVNSKTSETRKADALFIFIGARPYTDWIGLDIIKDEKGFLETGRDLKTYPSFGKIWKQERDPYLLETSCPGIFAAGDVRAGAMNRVASAVGEGSMAISFVHKYLAEV